MDKKQVRYGIVGIGKQGTFYTKIFTKLSSLVKGAKLTAVCDISPERRKYAEENLKGVKVFDNYQDMFESGLIDVVMVETPHYFHPQIATDAMKAGLNVLCDKPAGVYTKQVKEMNEEAKKHPELLFGMMFNQRTNPLYIKAKELIDSGRLGKLTRIVWIITDWYRPRAYYAQGGWRGTWWGEGGGVLLNQCPHQLDLFTWLAGLPVSVTATASTVGRDISVENDVTAYCKFANGATGTFIASTGDALGENRLEIIGTRARIRIENDQLTLDTLSVDERDWCPVCKEPFGVPEIQHEIVQTDGENPQHAGVLNAFAAHILHGTPLVADGREGIRGLMLSNAMHLSSWTNQTVSLPIDEELFLKLLNEKRRTSRHKDEVDAAIDVSGSFGSTRK